MQRSLPRRWHAGDRRNLATLEDRGETLRSRLLLQLQMDQLRLLT